MVAKNPSGCFCSLFTFIEHSCIEIHPKLPLCAGHPPLWFREDRCAMENICTESGSSDGHQQACSYLGVGIHYFTSNNWIFKAGHPDANGCSQSPVHSTDGIGIAA